MCDRGPVFERGPPLSEIQNSSIFSLDDVSDEEMNQLIDGTITAFDEGDLVTGTVVKIEHDEVLLDIGFKSEGVIPSRELSIRKDVDPTEIVGLGCTRIVGSSICTSTNPRARRRCSVAV